MAKPLREGEEVRFTHYSKQEKEAQVITGTLWFTHHTDAFIIDSKGTIYKARLNLLY